MYSFTVSVTSAEFVYDQKTRQYLCIGSWTILHLEKVLKIVNHFSSKANQPVIFNGEKLTHLDSAGALLLGRLRDAFHDQKIEWAHFKSEQLKLLDLVDSKRDAIEYIPPPPKKHNALYLLGKEAFFKISQIEGLFRLVGAILYKFYDAATSWKRLQFSSIISNIKTTGLQALPIIALLSFLIGVVLAYQMGLQLETYGANTFIAYLSGLACFREFAPLITAIIVAGRTSSSFTAQIGSMKINEEIDALETMGLSPIELLVLPKLMGLIIIFPLLIFWADLFSITGAMILSKLKLNIGYLDFLTRLRDTVGAKQMFLGLYKAPVFAILIALVGCFQGFNVKSNATSIGSQTTKSVVQALFLIIIADAAFSVIYSWLRL